MTVIGAVIGGPVDGCPVRHPGARENAGTMTPSDAGDSRAGGPPGGRRRGYGPGRRMATLIERRPTLFPFVVAVVASRVVLSVMTATEEPNDVLSLLITVLLVVEVVVVWRAVRAVRGRGPIPERSGHRGLDRALTMVERYGAPFIAVTTAACLVAFGILRAHHSGRQEILTVIAVARWVQLVLLLGVLYLARRWETGGTGEGGGRPVAGPPGGPARD